MNENTGPGRREVRIGDAEREAAVNDLGEHFAAGRLTEEEHTERTDRAYSARTQADLDALFDDLPRPGGQEEQAGQQAGQWGPPWAQGGPPPWAAAAWQGKRGGPPFKGLRWLPVPFLVLAAIGSVCAIAHGFFPFFVIPLLAIATVFFVLNKRGHLGGRGSRQQV